VITREEWAISLLRWMAFPVTQRNLVALIAWIAAEGGPPSPQAKWNPLNTTQPWPGATTFNWVGVKNYATHADGLNATAKTFQWTGHGYESIVERLKKSARPRRTLAAVEASSWGTGGLAKSIVDDVKRHYRSYADAPIGQ
jgi:hypothetical protein